MKKKELKRIVEQQEVEIKMYRMFMDMLERIGGEAIDKAIKDEQNP